MSDIAIRVDNLSKRYRIGARQHQLTTLRQRLTHLAASPFDYLRQQIRGPSEEEIIWALKDVSFEVKRGEVVGVIGRNGAGKSTLLKILSRITDPTEGRAEVYGRVGSLLEVGTGFHPELTGRENVYLNGAILGMTKAEIDRKFDEIVDFSGVEKFIDTPVKRYSSGMQVRLAFSVAAHLEPKILLVDEVLAVGDVQFQERCLDKMRNVTKRGRTVIFVSHNMSAVAALCPRSILLRHGTLINYDTTQSTIEQYLRLERSSEDAHEKTVYATNSDEAGVFHSIEWLNPTYWTLEYKEPIRLGIRVVTEDAMKANLEFRIRDYMGAPIALLAPGHFTKQLFELKKNETYDFLVETGALPLASGRYIVDMTVADPNKESYGAWNQAFSFTVTTCDPERTGFEYKNSDGSGAVYIPHRVLLR